MDKQHTKTLEPAKKTPNNQHMRTSPPIPTVPDTPLEQLAANWDQLVLVNYLLDENNQAQHHLFFWALVDREQKKEGFLKAIYLQIGDGKDKQTTAHRIYLSYWDINIASITGLVPHPAGLSLFTKEGLYYRLTYNKTLHLQAINDAWIKQHTHWTDKLVDYVKKLKKNSAYSSSRNSPAFLVDNLLPIIGIVPENDINNKQQAHLWYDTVYNRFIASHQLNFSLAYYNSEHIKEVSCLGTANYGKVAWLRQFFQKAYWL